jgi:hypothetical protein
MRALMRWAPLAMLLTLIASQAHAADPPVSATDLDRFLLDSGRRRAPAPEADTYRFLITGEHQIRYQAERSFPLVASPSAALARPGLIEQSLGQNQFVHHWLRITPRLQLRESLEIVAQLDLTGVVVGDKARDVHADNTPRDEYNGFSNIQARWLYAEYRLPFGHVRVGQQANDWGMGILRNSGDHPSLFGDYRYGAISERVLLAVKPGGADGDFNVAVAADLVYRDQLARLTAGQRAIQAVLAAYWEHDLDRVGLFTELRHQRVERDSTAPNLTYADDLDQVSLDLHARLVKPVPSDRKAFLYGEAEAAYVIGSTDLLRQAGQAKNQIRGWGGAARIGVVHTKRGSALRRARRQRDRDVKPTLITYGDVVGEIEMGYASGDADPYDGVQKRFTFDPNHKVGLLLFDEILRFQTARSATAAKDPALTTASRPTAGVDLLPSNGGVFGAQYIYPTFLYRPRHWLDLKGGAVVAQSTSEVVDPYRVATSGNYAGYRGGNRRRKDLGLELDAGFQSRFPLDYGVVGEIGAQAGVLFPGEALQDADGHDMPTQWIAIGRLGLQF